MAIPFPYEAELNVADVTRAAEQFYFQFLYIAKYSDEINTEAEVNLLKLNKLAFDHCRKYSITAAAVNVKFVPAIKERFAAHGVSWPDNATMIADLQTLRTAADAFFVFCRDVLPASIRDSAVYRSNPATGATSEVALFEAKPHAVDAQIATLRALFA